MYIILNVYVYHVVYRSNKSMKIWYDYVDNFCFLYGWISMILPYAQTTVDVTNYIVCEIDHFRKGLIIFLPLRRKTVSSRDRTRVLGSDTCEHKADALQNRGRFHNYDVAKISGEKFQLIIL